MCMELMPINYTGKIGLPVPPRSAQSLDISESPYEPMYITPNKVPSRKRPGEFCTLYTVPGGQEIYAREVNGAVHYFISLSNLMSGTYVLQM